MPPLVELTDRELLEAAASGDGHAFAAFYDRHAGAVFGYCRRVVDDDEDAADAAQDAFLALLARVHAEPGAVAHPAAYLFRTARNASLRAVAARRRARPVDELPEAAPAGVLPEGESKVLTEDLQASVRAANRELPVRQREVLALREVEGLSYQEIGERMELSANAAAQLAWRARGRFRALVRRGALGGITLRSLDCERAMTLTTLAEDGPLPGPDVAWLEEHLDECDRCRASRAVMAEAGATYRLWVPGVALVAAAREGLLARAGEVVGADWTALGPAGSVGTGSDAPSRGAGTVVAAVLAALALAAGGGALVLTGGNGGGDAGGGGGGTSAGAGGGGGGAGGGSTRGSGGARGGGDAARAGAGGGGTLAALPPALAGVVGGGGAGDDLAGGSDGPASGDGAGSGDRGATGGAGGGDGGTTGTAPSRDPAPGGLTPAPVLDPPGPADRAPVGAPRPPDASRPPEAPRPPDAPRPPVAPPPAPDPGPTVPPADPPAPPPPPPPPAEPPPPPREPPRPPPEPPPPPRDDGARPGSRPKDKDGEDGCPKPQKGNGKGPKHCPWGHDKRA